MTGSTKENGIVANWQHLQISLVNYQCLWPSPETKQDFVQRGAMCIDQTPRLKRCFKGEQPFSFGRHKSEKALYLLNTWKIFGIGIANIILIVPLPNLQ